MRKGIPVSPGVAVGVAYCIHEIFINPDTKRLEDHEVTAELANYETARDEAAAELRALQHKVAAQVGENEAQIFSAHELILRDSNFTNKVRGWVVDERLTAQAALHRLLEQYTVLFAKTNDEYLRERMNDLRDVVIRINAHLTQATNTDPELLNQPVILIADELLPSQVVALKGLVVKGIVTQAGSQTSHAAIIARSKGIPAVSGLRNILRQVKNGDTVVVDARGGHVLVNPDPEQRSAYLKLEREFFLLKNTLAENKDQPAVTADGIKLELLANINGAIDCSAAVAMGSAGVGLFRTEYIYLTHPDVPDEEEQYIAYRDAILATPGSTMTIRTLDIGGDKTVPYLGHTHQEANPFMGWRSIRLSFEHPEFFNTQLRAVLRAAAEGASVNTQVKLMFPMITTVEEVRKTRAMVRKAAQQLRAENKRFAEVPLGMMLEVPAAAISINDMLPLVDFVSIGSNDLVQYLMAADRDNPKVSHLCQPLAPPVLRVLATVIKACNKAGKPVTLCGEMAAQPRAFVLLFAMGLRSFSMSASFIPSMKELAAHLTEESCRTILRRALTLRTTSAVKRYMAEQLAILAPNLRMLDMD
ncbi:Phosphoenolpyruvate-protein phosphotransferase [Anatilimnocola aggregata]|uniref:Phosphoenolpyruvate-protein phosphotransferase n=1 Tax=Anatilimnocola aggregata TaxID=2528021 RepID=A0A517YJI2_9BACT|nr:phosphoenolpyruvate--protein phosphotransferase [Anatilimnocola aggregata]QDU30381.1 Phosphoenolpyruvate-protein phosphotransferase [Anatilimnocola aggregata]